MLGNRKKYNNKAFTLANSLVSGRPGPPPTVGRQCASTSVDRRLWLAGLAGEELPGFECDVGVAGPGVAANIDPDVLGGFFTVIEGQAGAVGDVTAGGG